METYLFKSSMALMIFYGVYRVIVHYSFDHQLNRFLGLACIIFSVSFSLIQLDVVVPAATLNQTLHSIAVNTAKFESSVSISSSGTNIFLILYGVGVAIFAVRWLFGLTSLLLLYVNSPKDRQWDFRIVKTGRDFSPFTFFNILFLGRQVPEHAQMDAIVLHEKVHRDHLHSLDAILLEFLTVIFWFHPAAWLFRSDIKAEHEYFADQEVLTSGVSPLRYQALLFEARTGISLRLGSYLSNRTSLTKRFTMMTKTKTSSARMRFSSALFLLTLMATIMFFSAFSSRTETQVDKVAQYQQGDEVMYKMIREKITYPKTARENNRMGMVNVTFTVNIKGKVENPSIAQSPQGHVLNEVVVVGYSKYSEVSKEVDEALKAEAIRVVASLGTFIPAQKDGKAVSSVLTLPIQFTLK